MPRRHDVRTIDVDPRRLAKTLLSVRESAPADFESLLMAEGVGAKTLRALAPTSELIYGDRASTRDPARFSLAHGGKDGTPFPVDRATYDRTIEALRTGVGESKAGRHEKLHALRRLASFAAG